MSPIALEANAHQWGRMEKRFTRAGGCLLSFAILIGFVFGAIWHEPMRGVLIGTIAGIAIAVLMWIVDRNR